MTCIGCGATKKLQNCEYCARPVCKNCSEFLSDDDFSFYPKAPKTIKLGAVCDECFITHVEPEKVIYDELMAKASEVYFLTKNYRGNVRISAKHTKRVSVASCLDRRETIMRLAFFAAQLGFNAILEGELVDKKIRVDGYQSTRWSGSAMPATIDGEHLERASLRGF